MKTQLIAITRADGSLALMHFVTHKPRRGAELGWAREATPENVAAEIERSGFDLDVVTWRLIEPEDLPVSREHRDRWRDNGNKIVVRGGP